MQEQSEERHGKIKWNACIFIYFEEKPHLITLWEASAYQPIVLKAQGCCGAFPQGPILPCGAVFGVCTQDIITHSLPIWWRPQVPCLGKELQNFWVSTWQSPTHNNRTPPLPLTSPWWNEARPQARPPSSSRSRIWCAHFLPQNWNLQSQCQTLTWAVCCNDDSIQGCSLPSTHCVPGAGLNEVLVLPVFLLQIAKLGSEKLGHLPKVVSAGKWRSWGFNPDPSASCIEWL